MSQHLRRYAVLGAAALTAGVALVAPARADAATTPVGDGATWLAGQLTGGLVHNDQYSFDDYGLTYLARPLPQQVASAWHKVFRLSLPNGWLATTNAKNLPSQLNLLRKVARADRKTRRRLLAELEARAAAQGAEEMSELVPA